MKPGNLSERMMVPNPAATKDEDSIFTHIESVGVRFFIFLSLRTSDRCHWCGNPLDFLETFGDSHASVRTGSE